MIIFLATALSGGMFYLSQGIDNIWLLAWIAPLPLLWLAYGETPRRWVLLASLVAFSLGQIYIFQCYGVALSIAVLLTVMAPLTFLFAFAILFARFAHRRLPFVATLFAFPACWTSFEYLISLISPHGSNGSLAYSQMSAPLLIQSASLFGVFAITFLLCLFANAVVLLARRETGARVAGGIGLAICMLNIVFGTVRLQQPQPDVIRSAALADETLLVASRRDNVEASQQAASDYAAAIRDVAAKGAKFIVTPEGGIMLKESWREAVFAPLKTVVRETGIRLVVGVYQRDPSGDLAVAFSPDGSSQSYAKRHLLLPLEAEFTPGHGPGLLGDGFATVICKDMDFPRTIRSDARSGIKIMAVPAGDFVRDDWIHARLAIMRGVENGFSVLRSSLQGLLTASDAHGRILARKTALQAGMTSIVADIPLGSGPTLYTNIGDVFSWFCLVLTLMLGGAGFIRIPPSKAHEAWP